MVTHGGQFFPRATACAGGRGDPQRRCQLWGRRSDRSRGTARCRCQASPSWLLPAQGCREGTSPPCLECQPGPGGLGWGGLCPRSILSGSYGSHTAPGMTLRLHIPRGPQAPPPPSLTGAPVTAGSSPLAAPSGPPLRSQRAPSPAAVQTQPAERAHLPPRAAPAARPPSFSNIFLSSDDRTFKQTPRHSHGTHTVCTPP